MSEFGMSECLKGCGIEGLKNRILVLRP